MAIPKLILILKRLYDTFSLKLRIQLYRAIGVKIGNSCFISAKAYIDKTKPEFIEIGNNCMITRGCMILCHSDAKLGGLKRLWGAREYKKVKLGNNVFLGVETTVMPGVKIGDNVVVGAKSLVTADIPPNSLAFGIPAKRVKPLKDFLKQ